MNIQASVAKRARRWPERGRADCGQELYRRGVAPLPSCGWPDPASVPASHSRDSGAGNLGVGSRTAAP